jgi:hypothetical protein
LTIFLIDNHLGLPSLSGCRRRDALFVSAASQRWKNFRAISAGIAMTGTGQCWSKQARKNREKMQNT